MGSYDSRYLNNHLSVNDPPYQVNPHDVRQKAAKCRQIAHELLRFGPYLMPNRIKLAPYETFERSEICIFQFQVIEVQLEGALSFCDRSLNQKAHHGIAFLEF